MTRDAGTFTFRAETAAIPPRRPTCRRLALQTKLAQAISTIGRQFDVLANVSPAAGQTDVLAGLHGEAGARQALSLLLCGGRRVEVVVDPAHRRVHGSRKGNARRAR